MDFGGADEIRFERIGKAGVATLTRPQALNALTHRMVTALSAALDAWERDPSVEAVVVRAEGRAFCAGGDLMLIYRAKGPTPETLAFFADEYRLNVRIANYPKPYVALVDGIVMGGGVGISFHGSHRVLTEKAQFAMPEVTIGFFPDVGGSFLLSHLKGSFGLFLGLTGSRLRVGDALRAGLATHAVASSDLDAVLSAICDTGQPDKALKPFMAQPEPQIDEATLFAIARLFSRESLEDMLVGLRQAAAAGDDVAARALASMAKASPTSLAVAFRQINTGAMLDIGECMSMEYRIVNRMLAGHDFYEGIRAVVVDKDQAPRWKPERSDDVDPADIERYFRAPAGGDLPL